MQDAEKILLGHGSGGLLMKQLIEDVFYSAYANSNLTSGDDAALLQEISLNNDECLAFSTDSFVVSPSFFPGGNIGNLAVCGTVNDVSTSGAKPLVLSIGFIIEEGFLISDLKKICKSIADSALEAKVKIVTGDTKVVNKGQVDGIYICTSGIGKCNKSIYLSGANCKPGDAVILSGSIGDHGICIMSCREGLNFSTDLKSDVAPLNFLVEECLEVAPDIRCFRDPTRGGIASTLNEFALQSNVDIVINEKDVPIKDGVKSACDMLGYDPMQVANEGKMICVAPADKAKAIVDTMRNNNYGKSAAIIGYITECRNKDLPKVYISTQYNTERILDMLVGESLPRIC